MTKGKWKVRKGDTSSRIKSQWMPKYTIEGVNEWFVCFTESKSNADLIASAPEMLDMLKKLNEYAPNTCRDLKVDELLEHIEGGK